MDVLAVFAVMQLMALDVPVSTPPIPGPPEDKELDPYLECSCSEESKVVATSFVGLVKDARLSLAPGGLSVISRQQTLFTVISSEDKSIKETAAIWHETNPKDCGVTFDYGKRYRVPVRRVKDGFETDYCLQPQKVN